MEIIIKNMVCDRCKWVVAQHLTQLGLPYQNIELGKVQFEQMPTASQIEALAQVLETSGFVLLTNKQSQLVEQIKTNIILLIHQQPQLLQKVKLSDWLAQKLDKDFKALSQLFSEQEGITVEQYFIVQKIARVKEFIQYNELSLSQIADLLHYSSVQHLSNQFKKVTGQTPSQYKENPQRKPLDFA